MARRLETAAARFKEFWEGGCPATAVSEGPAAAEWPPPALDPALMVLLRALERGGDDSVGHLADWFE